MSRSRPGREGARAGAGVDPRERARNKMKG